MQPIQLIMVTGKSGSGKQPRIDCLCNEFGAVQLSTGNIFRELIGKFNACGLATPLTSIWNTAAAAFHSDEEIARIFAAGCKTQPSPADLPKAILGAKAKYYVDNGLFVPDTLTNALFESAFCPMLEEGKKVVLDGFPRTIQQWEFLDALLHRLNKKIDFVLQVELDDDHIVRRATGRRICPKCQAVYHMMFQPPREGRFCKACPGDVEVKQRADDATEEKLRSRLREFAEKVAPMLEVVRAKVPFVVVPGHLESPTAEAISASVMGAVRPLLAAAPPTFM